MRNIRLGPWGGRARIGPLWSSSVEDADASLDRPSSRIDPTNRYKSGRESIGRPLVGPAERNAMEDGESPAGGQLPPAVTSTVPFLKSLAIVSSVMPAMASLTMSLV
jgi:hypothetical protein